jgi:integrase
MNAGSPSYVPSDTEASRSTLVLELRQAAGRFLGGRPTYLVPSCFLALSRAAARRYFGSDGVPVSAHGMRGLHGTLAVDGGITSHAVASALGHESFKTTAAHYAKREAVAGAQQKRALAVLTGGKLAS